MNKDYVILSDTDSIYCTVEDILRHRHKNIDLTDEEEVIPKIRNIALEFEEELNEWYVSSFSRNHFNAKENRLKIKSETIGKRIYISAKKQYAQLILEKEGVRMTGDKVWDFKGLDFMKSSFPLLYKQFTQDLVKSILLDSPKTDIDEKILKFREKFVTLSLGDAAKPTGINKMKEYLASGPRKGTIFSSFLPKAPANTRAATYYNDIIKFNGWQNKHPLIQVGDKIRWIYLKKNNPYNIDVLAYNEVDPPEELLEFMETYMDRAALFDKNLVKKLQKIYDNIGWGPINYNRNVSKFFSFN